MYRLRLQLKLCHTACWSAQYVGKERKLYDAVLQKYNIDEDELVREERAKKKVAEGAASGSSPSHAQPLPSPQLPVATMEQNVGGGGEGGGDKNGDTEAAAGLSRGSSYGRSGEGGEGCGSGSSSSGGGGGVKDERSSRGGSAAAPIQPMEPPKRVRPVSQTATAASSALRASTAIQTS